MPPTPYSFQFAPATCPRPSSATRHTPIGPQGQGISGIAGRAQREGEEGQLGRHEIDEELADHFGLSEEQRLQTVPSRKEKAWSNRIRWTRLALVQKGDLDGSQRGVWTVTEQGKRRVEGQSEDT